MKSMPWGAQTACVLYGGVRRHMESSALYSIAADAILVTHALFVAFVVVGLILVWATFCSGGG